MTALNEHRRAYLFATLLLVLVYLFAGFYPFHLKTSPGAQRVNGAMVLPNRTVQFCTPGIAYTDEAPSWLGDVTSTSRFEVSLEARTDDPKQSGPARIFTLSSDWFHRNLTVSQSGSFLAVGIRTPYTSYNGTPPYTVQDVFADPDWHQIDIRITPGAIEIRVDGDISVVAAMPDRPLKNWNPTYRVALGNELSGDQPWLGTIRKAVVRTVDGSIDYLAPGALSIPERFTLMERQPGILIPFVNVRYTQAALRDWTINLVGFVPFGWLVVMLCWPRPGAFLAIVLAAGISSTIETGQLLIFSDRVPSTEDFIMNTIGAALGAWFAGRLGYQSKGV